MSQTGWGKPKYGSQQFKKTGKPGKDPGHNFFRVLPPMFSLAQAGKWSVYKATHWGYSGEHPTDSSKHVVRPFLCIEESNRTTKMITKVCPECEYWRTLVAERDVKEAELKAQGMSGDALKSAMKGRVDHCKAHAPDRKVYINVKYPDGTFGDYKINYKIHFKGIEAKIKEVAEKYKFDALEPDGGVWFDINRIGNGWDPPDVVGLKTEPINPNDISAGERIIRAPLTQADWDQASSECRDLTTLGGSVLTFAQITALVASGGDTEAVDRAFGGKLNNYSAPAAPQAAVSAPPPEADDSEYDTDPVVSAPISITLAVDTSAPAKVAAATAEIQADVAAQVRYQRIKAEMAAKEDAARKAAEAAAAPAKAPLLNIESDKDFLLAFEEQQRKAAAAKAAA